MAKILIDLPDDLILYMEEDPYVSDQSKFVAMLIRRWIRDKKDSELPHEIDLKDPNILWDGFYE